MLKKITLSLAIVLLLCYIFSLVLGIRIEGIHDYTYYTELERIKGNWSGLIHWRVKAHQLVGVQIPELRDLHMVPFPMETWRGIERISDLQQADSITVYALIRHDVIVARARSGFFTWGKWETTHGHLVIMADTGSGFYVANEQFQIYSLPLPGAEIPLEEQARLRRNTLIPSGFHPSFLWVLLAYCGFVGVLLIESWRSQDLTVSEASRDRIVEGPVLKGYWPKIKGQAVTLPRFKYVSPVLKELLPGEEFRQVEISTFIVIQTRLKEVRTGPLVWARAKKIRVELMLVVDSGLTRFSTTVTPEVSNVEGAEFNDTPALFSKAASRKKWLIPAGLIWR